MFFLTRLFSLIKLLRKVNPWLVRTYVQKLLIHLQERFGLYPYTRWRRRFLREERRKREPELAVTFAIFLDTPHEPSMQTASDGMVQSLQNDTSLRWKVYNLPQSLGQVENQNVHKPIIENREDATVDENCFYLFTQQEWSELICSTEGEWVGFWGQADAAEWNLLSDAMECLDGTAEVVYFDEDCFTENGSPMYHSPFFKPDWSPELLISVNYMRRAIFRRQVLLDGLRKVDPDALINLDDLIFLGCEAAQNIVHLSGPFYHNRVDRLGLSNPAYSPATPQSIAAHLKRRGIQNPQVAVTIHGIVHATWRTQEKMVSIIIPTKDKVEFLERCIRSIKEVNQYSNYEVILVDSGSREDATKQYYDSLKADTKVRIIDYLGKFNYSRANNLGAEHARGELLLFLNNDVEAIDPNWLSELVQWAEQPQIGIVGAKLLYPIGLIQHAGIVLGMEGHASHVFMGMGEGPSDLPFGSADWYRNYLAVTGACMMVRKEVFESIGRFDEAYQLVFGDVEMCVRAVEQGYRVVYNPFARLIHHEGKTRGKQMVSGDIHKAFARFKALVATGDPYYNRYLTHAVHTPVLRRHWEDDPLQRLERIDRDY